MTTTQTKKKTSKRKIKTPGVYQDDNGTFYLKYKNKTYRGFKTVEEAEIKKAQLRLNGDDVSTAKFTVIAKDFIEVEETKFKSNKISYDTFSKKRQLSRMYIEPLIGEYRLNKLTPMILRDFRNNILSLDRSSKIKNAILATTKQILKHAMLYFEFNKDLSIFLETIPKTKEEIEKKKQRFSYIWGDDEFNIFIDHVEDDCYKMLFTLFFKHGLRLGEALALRWTELNQDKYTLIIDGSITKKTGGKGRKRKGTKTDYSTREIYIGKKRTQELLAIKNNAMSLFGFDESWYMLGSNRPLAETSITRVKDKACNDAKLQRIWNHDMRHMFVTNSWSKVPLPALSRYIGHKNVGITLERYSHLSQEDNATFNAFIDEIA